MVVLFLIFLTTSVYGFEVSINSTELFHYDYLEVEVKGFDDSILNYTNTYLILTKDEGNLPDFLGRDKIKPIVSKNSLVFLYIPPYGVRDGIYDLIIFSEDNVLFKTNLVFFSRQQARLIEPLKVLTFEENLDIRDLFSEKDKGKKNTQRSSKIPSRRKKVFTPYYANLKQDDPLVGGRRKLTYSEVADKIASIMLSSDLNTFLMLGGQTTYLKDKKNIWYPVVLSNLNVLKYLKDKRIQTGAYVMCFLTLGQDKKNIFKGYKPIKILRNGKVIDEYKFTSITSSKRIKDIIDILTYIGRLDYVDFLGLDFIRVGDYGGYELIPDFYNEILSKLNLDSTTNTLYPTNDIHRMSRFIASNEKLRRVFRWYQSVRVSRVIKKIKEELMSRGVNKPLIAFMLGWNAGREHGQDLFMFRDAGIDYSFYMLYEFYTDQMFEEAGNYYLRYVYNLDSNIVFGNIVDSILNRGSQEALDTFSNRLKMFVTHYSYFPPNGFFIHDLYRILHGRIKPHTRTEWLLKIKETVMFIDQSETLKRRY